MSLLGVFCDKVSLGDNLRLSNVSVSLRKLKKPLPGFEAFGNKRCFGVVSDVM